MAVHFHEEDLPADVTFADGVLTAGPLRMRVGAPGDQVALGRVSGPPVLLPERPVAG